MYNKHSNRDGRIERLAAGLPFAVSAMNQGVEGACSVFGLTAVVHALLRMRAPDPANVAPDPVSTRMLYDMARHYDVWEGETHAGSSCHGAMKGWYRHGVYWQTLWQHAPGEYVDMYTEEHARDAQQRPLGAYCRVNHKDLAAMHAAIVEAGVL